MSVVRKVSIKITGQVADDYRDNDYSIMLAKLQLVCAEYNLDLEEAYE